LLRGTPFAILLLPALARTPAKLEWNPETLRVAYIYGDQSVYWYVAVLTLGVLSACVARLDAGGQRVRQSAFFACLVLVSCMTAALLMARHEAWSIAGFTLGMMTVIAVWDVKPTVQPELS
jgi:hypothetical protein